MKKVGIVVCNYNKAEAVSDCIQCIFESKFKDFDLYVVDNASTDGSPSVIRERFGDSVNLIVNSQNLGGSGGFNTGLRIAYKKGYPYLMCVDNDAMLDENAIGNLYEFLESHPETGMAGSKIYHMENPDYIQQFGQTIDFDYFCTEVPYLNRIEDGTLPEYLYVDSVAACSLMIKRSTIEKIGLMPEENFLYWDDTEWCYLCNRAGLKVASVGNSVALHAMGAKKEDVNTFPTYYAWRNWISFFIKYTTEERLSDMADTFLKSVFEVVYEGLHKNEKNKACTVMMAYDDAIHNVTGKAGDNRIFDLDINYSSYTELFRSGNSFYINENNFPVLAERIRKISDKLCIAVTWKSAPSPSATNIILCENIFHIDDLSLKNVYIDVNDCILRTEDDALNVINYNYSLRSFMFAQKPVFMEKIKELRGL